MNAPGRPLSSDLMDALAAIETEYPVLEWSCNGIPVWPLLRIRWVFAEWARHYTIPSGSTNATPSLHRLRTLFIGPLAAISADRKDAEGCDRVPSRRDILFLSDGVSFAKIGSKWVERFCDPILSSSKDLGLTSAMLTPSHLLYHPRHTPSRFIQPALDRVNVFGALWARVAPIRTHLPGHAQVINRLKESGFGTHNLSGGKIRSDFTRLDRLSRYYGKHLRRIRPSLAFMVSYYGVEGMAFILACRRHGVPVVDVQHGVQGEMHPAYAAWPAPGNGRTHTLLPDIFWVWSEWERSVIKRWSEGTGHRAIVGGNPWNAIWADGSQWPGVVGSLEAARALKDRAKGKPIVLVTLQYGLVPEEQLLPLVDLLRKASGLLAFWIRLHPLMLERRAEIRELLKPAGDFEMDEATDIPLPAVLHFADVHLTHSSSTVIEAAQAGLGSVVTTAYGAELFAPIFASGMARLETGDAKSVAAALLELATLTPKRGEQVPPVRACLDRILNEIATQRGKNP